MRHVDKHKRKFIDQYRSVNSFIMDMNAEGKLSKEEHQQLVASLNRIQNEAGLKNNAILSDPYEMPYTIYKDSAEECLKTLESVRPDLMELFSSQLKSRPR